MFRRSFVMALAMACLVPLSNRLQAQVVMRVSSQAGGTFAAPLAMYSAGGRVWGGSSYVPNDPMTMLRLPQFSEELQLVDSQLEQLRQLQEETTKLQRAMYAEMRVPAGQPQTDWQVRQTLMRQKQTEMREKTQAGLDEILLPHQQERLRELRFQMDLRNRRGQRLNRRRSGRRPEPDGRAEATVGPEAGGVAAQAARGHSETPPGVSLRNHRRCAHRDAAAQAAAVGRRDLRGAPARLPRHVQPGVVDRVDGRKGREEGPARRENRG